MLLSFLERLLDSAAAAPYARFVNTNNVWVMFFCQAHTSNWLPLLKDMPDNSDVCIKGRWQITMTPERAIAKHSLIWATSLVAASAQTACA